MLTEQQKECIELLCTKNMEIQEIAKRIGCDRRTIHRWRTANEEFKRELDKQSHLFESGLINEAQSLFKRMLNKAVRNIAEIADDKTEKAETRLKANQYLVDRVLGNTTTKIEQSSDDKTNDKAPVDIDKTLENIKKQGKKLGNNQVKFG